MKLAARNQELGVTRRRFVGITLASGAALLAGKSDVILGADTAIIKYGYKSDV